jgi:hypothetical protein
MKRAIVKTNPILVIEPRKSVFEPSFVVSLRKIFPGVSAATLRSTDRGMKAQGRLGEHVVELERCSTMA